MKKLMTKKTRNKEPNAQPRRGTVMRRVDIKEYLLSKTAHRFCDSMGLEEVVETQRRKSGMTSSGRPQECHQNVSKLVACYGGKQVLGYLVNYIEFTKTSFFIPHSI